MLLDERLGDVLVVLPLDGPPGPHDAHRLRRGLAPDHRRVLATARFLRRRGVECEVHCAVHAANAARPLEVYRYLRDEVGVRRIEFVPVVERAGEAVTDWSVRPEEWGEFLITVFDEWVRRDVGTQDVRNFARALASWSREGPARALPATPALSAYCRACPVLFACGGGAPAHRFATAPDGGLGHGYLCEGNWSFYRHADQPLRVMAALARTNADPATIMRVLARADHPEPPPRRRLHA